VSRTPKADAPVGVVVATGINRSTRLGSTMKREKYRWDRQPLGGISDGQIARRLGCVPSAVWFARARRGIAPFREYRSRVILDNALAVFGRLPIDKWTFAERLREHLGEDIGERRVYRLLNLLVTCGDLSVKVEYSERVGYAIRHYRRAR